MILCYSYCRISGLGRKKIPEDPPEKAQKSFTFSIRRDRFIISMVKKDNFGKSVGKVEYPQKCSKIQATGWWVLQISSGWLIPIDSENSLKMRSGTKKFWRDSIGFHIWVQS